MRFTTTVAYLRLKYYLLVIEEKGLRLKLTVTDTPGFGDHVDNSNWSVDESYEDSYKIIKIA